VINGIVRYSRMNRDPVKNLHKPSYLLHGKIQGAIIRFIEKRQIISKKILILGLLLDIGIITG